MSCIFCEINDYILENELAFAIFDKFPVNKGDTSAPQGGLRGVIPEKMKY